MKKRSIIHRLLHFYRPRRYSDYRVVEKYSLRFDNEDVNEYKQLHSPYNKFRSNLCVVGTCNGLVCLADDIINYYILWNPLIKKVIRLNKPSVIRFLHAFNGFGFDAKTNDYKLLRFFGFLDNESVEAEVYSLNANCWTSITSIAPNYIPLYNRYYYGNSFVNGAIHMLAFSDKNGGRVLAFDVSEEVFSEITLPDNLSIVSSYSRAQLLKYGESSIAVMSWERRERNHLWVMKEYGVATSWAKVFTEAVESVPPPRVLCLRQDEEQVLVASIDGCIASLDIKTKQYSEVSGVESMDRCLVVDNYVESLVLLDKCCN